MWNMRWRMPGFCNFRGRSDLCHRRECLPQLRHMCFCLSAGSYRWSLSSAVTIKAARETGQFSLNIFRNLYWFHTICGCNKNILHVVSPVWLLSYIIPYSTRWFICYPRQTCAITKCIWLNRHNCWRYSHIFDTCTVIKSAVANDSNTRWDYNTTPRTSCP